VFSDLFCAMPNHDDNLLDLSRAQIADAAFDDGAIAKRKQRLKGAHATRASRGEDNSGYFSHIQKLTTKAIPRKCFMVFVPLWLFVSRFDHFSETRKQDVTTTRAEHVAYIRASSACASS